MQNKYRTLNELVLRNNEKLKRFSYLFQYLEEIKRSLKSNRLEVIHKVVPDFPNPVVLSTWKEFNILNQLPESL